MYNDYYLEQINNKLNNTNLYLDEISENQATIITNQQAIISGDREIIANLVNATQVNLAICCCLVLYVLYTFIKGCFRC